MGTIFTVYSSTADTGVDSTLIVPSSTCTTSPTSGVHTPFYCALFQIILKYRIPLVNNIAEIDKPDTINYIFKILSTISQR